MFKEISMKESMNVNGGDLHSIVWATLATGATIALMPAAASAVAAGAACFFIGAVAYEYMENQPRYAPTEGEYRMRFDSGYWRNY